MNYQYKDIKLFVHCRNCLSKKPKKMSPNEYGLLEVGKTKKGILVWCKRCDQEVIHFDIDIPESLEKSMQDSIECQCEMCNKLIKEY